MALKAVHVSQVPRLDEVPSSVGLVEQRVPPASSFAPARFLVIGHRGKGMNALASSDPRMRAVKENSVRSFNEAGRFPIDFVEFDVQVTKDEFPIIFHDDFILSEESGNMSEKRVTELSLKEFLSYGPQTEPTKVLGKSLLRKTKDGKVFKWNVEFDAPFCTLQEVFQSVDSHLGCNIELKFDDNIVYEEDDLIRTLQAILQVVFEYANDRPIIFSSFQPDAAQLMRKLQSVYPVLFLTNGGNETYTDVRRNSLDEAIKLCLASGLQGIVAEVRSIFRNPSSISRIKESNLGLMTYGQLNNVPEAVYLQHLMGINGVIVDLVQEISEAVSDFIENKEGDEVSCLVVGEVNGKVAARPNFSQRELSFLLKLIPELVQHQ